MNREEAPGKSPEDMYIQQKVRVLLMLKKMGSNLTPSEEAFLRNYAADPAQIVTSNAVAAPTNTTALQLLQRWSHPYGRFSVYSDCKDSRDAARSSVVIYVTGVGAFLTLKVFMEGKSDDVSVVAVIYVIHHPGAPLSTGRLTEVDITSCNRTLFTHRRSGAELQQQRGLNGIEGSDLSVIIEEQEADSSVCYSTSDQWLEVAFPTTGFGIYNTSTATLKAVVANTYNRLLIYKIVDDKHVGCRGRGDGVLTVRDGRSAPVTFAPTPPPSFRPSASRILAPLPLHPALHVIHNNSTNATLMSSGEEGAPGGDGRGGEETPGEL
ncbi:Beta-catenin-interacting protein 1 [Larimichthys crocea]|uniref:Uncharacterized protein n=1 Tax=Larimichthys crocea TaxID=215358 RepID=A0ACD3RAX3_LARCR|nr:Beta-catenin-interacting protein 1 [Larimichthys crocea]